MSRQTTIEQLMQDNYAIKHKMMAGHVRHKQFNVTPTQGFVMRIIGLNPAANVKAISKELKISSSAATQLVDGLVAKGYLVRKPSAEDRRVVTFGITSKARKLFTAFKKMGLAKMTALFAGLTDEELAQYARINRKILETITK